MVTGRPSKYPPDFQARAVQVVKESGRPIPQVALELGLGSETPRRWVRQDEANRGERKDLPSV